MFTIGDIVEVIDTKEYMEEEFSYRGKYTKGDKAKVIEVDIQNVILCGDSDRQDIWVDNSSIKLINYQTFETIKMTNNSQRVTDDNIQVEKPELYLYNNCQVVNIYKARQAYSIVYENVGGGYCHAWADASDLILKPQFEPKVGKYYQFSNWDDFLDYEIGELLKYKIGEYYTTVNCLKYRYCQPIPKDLKELFVFEE